MATKNIETIARETLIIELVKFAEDHGWACERVHDFGTVAIEIPVGEKDARWLTVKAVAPKLKDKDGNELWDLDDEVVAFEDRVKKEQEKEETKAKKELESKARQAKAKAKAEELARKKAERVSTGVN